MEALETQTALAALEKMKSDGSTGPLEVLSKIGLDVKSVTDAHRSLAEAYKDMVEVERGTRTVLEERTKEAEKRAMAAELELVKTTVTQVVDDLRRQLERLELALQQKPKEEKQDPLMQTVQEVAASALRNVLSRNLSEPERQDPLEHIMRSLQVVEALREKLGGEQAGSAGPAVQNAPPHVVVEIEKVNREFELRKLEMERDERRHKQTVEVLDKVANSLGNLAQAIFATLLARQPQVQPAAGTAPAQPAGGDL